MEQIEITRNEDDIVTVLQRWDLGYVKHCRKLAAQYPSNVPSEPQDVRLQPLGDRTHIFTTYIASPSKI